MEAFHFERAAQTGLAGTDFHSAGQTTPGHPNFMADANDQPCRPGVRRLSCRARWAPQPRRSAVRGLRCGRRHRHGHARLSVSEPYLNLAAGPAAQLPACLGPPHHLNLSYNSGMSSRRQAAFSVSAKLAEFLHVEVTGDARHDRRLSACPAADDSVRLSPTLASNYNNSAPARADQRQHGHRLRIALPMEQGRL